MTPILSVVIIGRNEGARLRRCLESVKAMDNPGGPVEVIYVDSASTDRSAELAATFGAKVIAVHPQRPTAALGRNAGWRVASAPFVLFLDGDTILHPQFVADSLAEFSNPELAIVWGHRREINVAGSLFNRVLDLDWIYRPGITEFCGGDAIVRRSALEDIDGFDERLIAGEEPEMCRRMRARGLRILHVDRPMTGHDLAMTSWAQYWKRATRAGYAYAEVSTRFRGTGLPFWEADARRNRNRAITLIGIAVLGPLFSAAIASPLPLIATVLLLSLLFVRSAWKARWKSGDPLTAVLYGIHSHLQQIPIFLGQLQYQRDAKSGRKRGLIEYKEASS
jgi:cellulose synthase/poly-beta-1,6-N-acetylglucosamine synthase-like glycosyltransferase